MSSPSTTATRIVIAEDEAIIRMDLVEILTEEGYEIVAECSNGEQAIDAVGVHEPDLALLDVKMPVMDGISAARVLVETRACAVVLLTAFSQRDLIADARDAGVLAYVVKPFERSDLVPAIEMAVGQHRRLAELHGRVDDLATQLENRKIAERAKGRLIDQHQLSEADAFAFMQRTAMNRRCTMREVADQILDGTLVP